MIRTPIVALAFARATHHGPTSQAPTLMAGKAQLSTLFKPLGQYYTYAGSLTTPGCNELVTWVVMETPLVVSLATLNKFKV